MGDPVVIVEAGAKAKTIQQEFGAAIESLVISSAPVKAVAIPPADELKRESLRFKFEPLPSQQESIDRLLAVAGKEIYLALDGDQRNEYWAWLISGFLESATEGRQLPKRLHLTGLCGEELRESFRLVTTVQSEKATAYYVRMLFDSYLGKHLRRLIGTPAGPENLPLNYHSLTTLFLLAEREEEIRMFTPVERWQVSVNLATDQGSFQARLEEAYGITDDSVFRTVEEAKKAVEMFKDEPFEVREVEREPLEIPPPAPYRLAQLLNDAHAAYGLAPKQAFAAVQKLFYGIELGGKYVGLISSYLPGPGEVPMTALVGRLRDQVGKTYGAQAVRAGTDGAEIAGGILPLHPALGREELQEALSDEELLVYDLIRARALASQMETARGENMIVELNAGKNCLFKASRRTIAAKGFLQAYSGLHYRELLAPCPLLELAPGSQVRCEQIVPGHGGGFPPEHYNLESLAADWEEFGLALDSLTITMLQYMMDKGYLALMADGTIRCQTNAFKLYAVMKKAFPTMAGIHLSAYLQQTIWEVAAGRKTLPFALKQFDQTLMMRGEVLVRIVLPQQVKKRTHTSSRIIKTPAGPAAGVPPAGPRPEIVEPPPVAEEPGAIQAEGISPAAPAEVEAPAESEVSAAPVETAVPQELPSEPAGPEPGGGLEIAAETEAGLPEEPLDPAFEPEPPGESHEAWPAKTVETEEERREWARVFAEAPGRTLSEEPPKEAERVLAGPARECPDCGRQMLLKEDRFGKYWSCSGYPECRHSESYGKGAGLEMLCPLCQAGNIITKHTPTGKLFYVCPEKSCEFMAWSRPHDIGCRVCDSPFLVEKKETGGRMVLRCPRAGCNYTEPLPGGEGGGEAAAPAAAPRRKVLVRRVGKGSGAAGGKVRRVRVVRRKA